MTKTILVALLIGSGCYGAPTPTTCYEKYVRDKRGDAIEDTYDNCLAHANKCRSSAQDEHRGEPTKNTEQTVHKTAPAIAPPRVVPAQAPLERVFGKQQGAL